MKDDRVSDSRYCESCQKEFWQRVFQLELEYLVERLEGCRDVLSIGCGPAILEGDLAKRGFNLTGLDVSQEALNQAPDQVRTIAGRAEDMSFPNNSFDAVIYVASLQFIEDYREALAKSFFVLRPNGRIIVMLLNPESDFFKKKIRDPNSYVQQIRHTDLTEIASEMAKNFRIQMDYFLGVKDNILFESKKADEAILYIIQGEIVSAAAEN